MSGRSSLNSQLYLGSVAVNDLQDGSLELFLGLLVYVEAVAVVRTEDGGQGELQGPGVSVDSHEVRQREVRLLLRHLGVLGPVQLAGEAPVVDTLRCGHGGDPLVSLLAALLLYS